MHANRHAPTCPKAGATQPRSPSRPGSDGLGPSRPRSLAGAAIALALTIGVADAWAAGPRVLAVDDAVRVRRGDTGLAPRPDDPIARPDGSVKLGALRGEVVAFQVVVEAGDAPLDGVTVDVAIAPAPGAKPGAALRVDRFVEHVVDVSNRSRNDKNPAESLGWSKGARPKDDRVLGLVPDALIPVEHAPAFCPYPLAIAPRTAHAVWIDVEVPEGAAPGAYAGEAKVAVKGQPLATVPVTLAVTDAVLPYRAVSFFTHYDPNDELEPRIGGGFATEASLWQLLHRHHVDALANLASKADVDRLAPALDGTLFTAAHGYAGPGEGVPPAVAAIGTYGGLGDARPEALARVREVAPRVPRGIDDLFLYAVDEDCRSPRGPSWKRLLAGAPDLARVRVGHTCSEDPSGQGVDLVMMAAQAFDLALARRARAAGKAVWVYNGHRPQTGALELDSEPTDARALGWIAATRDVGRWFLWESTFWNDSNKGGHGPIDPFVTAESFHNDDGDRALFDGLLVYPGTQARFPAHSIGLRAVLPSIRLKSLRRGIEDAGYLALARAASREKADALGTAVVGSAFAEVGARGRTGFPADGVSYAKAREALRALIPPGATLRHAEVETLLRDGAEARTATKEKRQSTIQLAALLALVVTTGMITAVVVRGRRRSLTLPSPPSA
jgi:hypothetical protein